MFTRNKVIISIVISILTLLISYVLGNTSIPFPDEMGVLQGWEKFKEWNGWEKDSIPDEVMLVNVAYDKQLVDYSVNNIPIGQYAITDRRKLYDFLYKAHQADNYKYIMLDVFFEKGVESPQDSALFHLIANMDRMVIPVHEDLLLQDSILYAKAANADYTITWEENDFARFQFIHDGVKSMPLRMYEDICGKAINKWWFLYLSNNWFCWNGITLKMPIRMNGETTINGDLQMFNSLNLGADLLAMDSISPISEEIKDKIVVIGNFKDDVHDTYVGSQPGSVICLNAYYALQRGDHLIWGRYGSTLLFFILMAFVYFGLSIACVNGISLSSMTNNPWLKLILSFASINLCIWGIAILAYITPLDLVYNVWVPISVFTLLDFIMNIYSSYNTKKNEKNNIPVSDGDADDCVNESSKLQDSLCELSADQS